MNSANNGKPMVAIKGLQGQCFVERIDHIIED